MFNSFWLFLIYSFHDIEEEGIDIKILPVKSDGHIDLDLLRDTISDKTLLVTAMTVNNEIGIIHPLKQI